MKNEIPNPESSKKIQDTQGLQSNVTICAKAVLARADKYQSYKYEKRKSASVGLCCSALDSSSVKGKLDAKLGAGLDQLHIYLSIFLNLSSFSSKVNVCRAWHQRFHRFYQIQQPLDLLWRRWERLWSMSWYSSCWASESVSSCLQIFGSLVA